MGWNNVYREDTGWLDMPLNVVSNEYYHVNSGAPCSNAGCVEDTWNGGKYTDANGVVWYREEVRTATVGN